MREKRRFDQNGSTFEDMFKQVIDFKVDDFLMKKTKQKTREGNDLNDL